MTSESQLSQESTRSFPYSAQSEDGQPISGTVDALDAETAMKRLYAMRLRRVEIAPTAQSRSTGRLMRRDDFATFNQQLAQLTGAGLPLEQGLRLMAAEVRRGRVGRTIERLTAELEIGTPLDAAVEKYRNQFPPLYSQLVRAGVKGGNLSAVLFSLGRHLDLIQRLRAMLWRALSYPMVVLVGIALLLSFLGMAVLPEFARVYADFHIRLPQITEALLSLSTVAPFLLGAVIALVVLGPITWGILRGAGLSERVAETILLPLPLIGPVLRANLVARWCDGVRVGVDAGLDLPASITIADEAIASQRLAKDGDALVAALAAGRKLTDASTRLLPRTVPAAMQFASGASDLSASLESLAAMYQRQAETRMEAIPGILTPALILLVACLIGFVIAALLAPLLSVLNVLTQGIRF